MPQYYEFKTHAGTFRIISLGTHWHAMFEEEDLGGYDAPTMALDDLVGGHTFWPSCGDPSSFSLPDELSGWEVVRVR